MTVPVPVPANVTVNVTGGGVTGSKSAFTFVFWVKVSVQVLLLPLHEPLHPAKEELAPAVAVSFTFVPEGKPALQVFGQLIPPGELVTLPDPLPIRLMFTIG